MLTYLCPVQSKLAKLINFASRCLEWGAASVHEDFSRISSDLCGLTEEKYCEIVGLIDAANQEQSYLTSSSEAPIQLSSIRVREPSLNIATYAVRCDRSSLSLSIISSLSNIDRNSFRRKKIRCPKTIVDEKIFLQKFLGFDFSISQKILGVRHGAP